MRLIFFLVAFVIGAQASDKYVTVQDMEARFTLLESNMEMLVMKCQRDIDLENRLRALELQMRNIHRHEDDETGDDSKRFEIVPLLNDTNLEERVQALEFQMANVHDDITSLNT